MLKRPEHMAFGSQASAPLHGASSGGPVRQPDGRRQGAIEGSRTSPEPRLRPESILQLAPNLRMRIDAGGHVLIDAPVGTTVDIGPRGFSILELFAQPISLGDAIEQLEAEFGGSTEFAPAMNVVNMLMEERALVVSGDIRLAASGWADPIEHARMLDDDRRTRDFIAALASAIQPDTVVLDIGTGSGVLAVAAARAGARHVYAVEASDIAEVAAQVFVLNGVHDRVTLVPGWSRQIALPEPADLLVTEVIGNEPLEEEILETVLDARRRLLKPGARMIPHALDLVARPLLLPDAEISQRVLGRSAVARWRDLYAMDFQPLLDRASVDPVHTVTEGEVAATWAPVGPPAILASVDLTRLDEASVAGSADLLVGAPGRVNAVAVTFRAHLYEGIVHALDPWRWASSSWATSVWALPEPLEIGPQAVLRVHYRHRGAGEPDGLAVETREGGVT